MALSTVTLTWNLTDFRQTGIPDNCTLWVTPTSILAATTDNKVIPAIPRTVAFTGGTGSLSGIVATDNASLVPAGWAYSIQVTGPNGQPIVGPFLTKIDFANGASQDLADLYASQVASAATYFQYVTMPQLQAQVTSMISPTLGTCQSVLLYGADPTGATASDAAFAAAVTACLGTGNPATQNRTAKGYVYIPAGAYRLTLDWLIRSAVGLKVIGDGRFTTTIFAHGTGFTNAVVDMDGIINCELTGLTITGDGTEGVASTSVPIPWALRVTKNTGTFTNTTQNCFSQIDIQAFNWQGGFLQGAPAGTTTQVDGNTISEVLVNGGGSSTFTFTTKWLVGFQCGNGIFGNTYNFVFTNCAAAQVQTGAWCNASGWEWYGGEPAANVTDYLLLPAAQVSIAGIQSQNSARFIAQTAGGSGENPISIRDCMFYTATIAGDGKWVKVDAQARAYEFSSVSCYSLTATAPIMAFNGQGNPEVITLINVAQNNTFAAGVTTALSPVVALKYMQLDNSFQTVAVTNQVPGSSGTAQATFFTASGTWTKPSGAKVVNVTAVSGAAGGGSGGSITAGTAAVGGGGGTGGTYITREFAAADLPSTVAVTVGAGGAGGAAVTGAVGNAGSFGAATTFGSILLAALAFSGGGGGGAAAGGGGGVSPYGFALGNLGGGATASVTGTAGAAPNSSVVPVGQGGSSGGGITSGGVASNGGAGTKPALANDGVGGAGGVVAGASPTSGTASTLANGSLGPSAGGGAASVTGAAQAGANALANSGAGGSGGGASLAANASGKGGNGGSGWLLAVTYF